jgi:hypothetical protein
MNKFEINFYRTSRDRIIYQQKGFLQKVMYQLTKKKIICQSLETDSDFPMSDYDQKSSDG